MATRSLMRVPWSWVLASLLVPERARPSFDRAVAYLFRPRFPGSGGADSSPWTIAGRRPATMFAVPADQATIIARPRLFDALDAGTEAPLTLVSAPPGAGKTVLLASWIGAGRPPGPVAWLSLDAANA